MMTGRNFLLPLFFASHLFAQHWTTLKTQRFEIYTTRDQTAALQDLAYLQSIGSFFDSARPFGKSGDAKAVQVISFRSKTEYEPYAFRAEGGGYYFHTQKYDYILIGETGAHERSLVAHEFTHMVVTQAGLKLPIWLNEGLADFYSTVELTDTQATVGRAPNLYLETLRNGRLLPWDTLFAVDGTSSAYSVGENLPLLYSQSWALTHMLKLDEAYAAHFPQFLKAISDGKTSRDSLQAVYHKSLSQIDSDLSAYLKKRKLPVSVLDCPRQTAPPAPLISDAADFDVQFALANVLASKPASRTDGLQRLQNLAISYPDRPEADEEIGMLALQQNKKEEARRYFQAAIQRHSKDAEILYNTAVLEKEAGAKYAPVSALFRRALEIQPDMDKARLELGLLEYEDFQYKSALALLSGVAVIPDDAKFEAYFTIAQCYVNLDDTAKAEAFVKKAAQAARNEDQKEQAADLLESVLRDAGTDSPAPSQPIKVEPKITNARGIAKSLQCDGDQKRLTLDVDGRDMTFDVSDSHLVVRHPNEDYARWSCGPIKAVPLTVVYAALANSPEKTAGKAIELVF